MLLKEMQAPQHAKVVRVTRLSPGPHTSFPLVKVEFESNKLREEVLQCGRNLKVSINFRGAFVCASKSQSARQTINNFRSLIISIPGVKEQVHVNHNGRVLPNRTSVTQFNQHNQAHSTKAWSNGPPWTQTSTSSHLQNYAPGPSQQDIFPPQHHNQGPNLG